MTVRVNQPDTDADVELRACLDEKPLRSFVMKAGAGSGKTTSLVKALAHLSLRHGDALRRNGQQIACITYTEVAVGEIWGDVGNAPLFHVSTIHSFLWTIMKPFQNDIRAWVDLRIAEKADDATARIDSPGTQAATKSRLQADLERYAMQREAIKTVSRFSYGMGSNYAEGILGHDDILKLGPALIVQSALMRQVVAGRFPYLFVDESQDTNESVVEAFRAIARAQEGKFCLGFFGDPMQKIYLTGIGPIDRDEKWADITKPENFRCPRRVLDVVNKIRAEDDGLEQTGGRTVRQGDQQVTVPGTARIFVLPADNRTQRLGAVREWLSKTDNEPKWLQDDADSGVKVMVLVHRMAAERLGFGGIYAALNDHGQSSLKDGLLDGSSWILRPFLQFVLPIVRASRAGRDFEVMTLLRSSCPLFQKDQLTAQNARELLNKVKADLDALIAMTPQEGGATTREVLAFLMERNLFTVDDRIRSRVEGLPLEAAAEDGEDGSVIAFFACHVSELWNYDNYIRNQSPFDTHQGVKGAEFERVLVILDDDEAKYNLFSFGKYFGITALSPTDRQNRVDGKDSAIERTRRLFYVCCSRAVNDLAVVFYVPADQITPAVTAAKSYFADADVLSL